MLPEGTNQNNRCGMANEFREAGQPRGMTPARTKALMALVAVITIIAAVVPTVVSAVASIAPVPAITAVAAGNRCVGIRIELDSRI